MTRPPVPISKMPFEKYAPTLPLVLADRTWPSRQLTAAPRWCSVDLRDGNQALIDPMGPDRKLSLFEALLAIGLKEIEVGFPSASAARLRLRPPHHRRGPDPRGRVRSGAGPVPRRTDRAHFRRHLAAPPGPSSTSTTRRPNCNGEWCSARTGPGYVDIATSAARLCRQLEKTVGGTEVRYEYSPESFTGTEPDFALEICEAVAEVIEPTAAAPLVLNLPSTVEMYSPNVFADVIEWFGRQLSRRDSFVLSVHPHNDRGTAVAAAELALLGGADRLEGTLFGNGERTGNLDIVTVALNLFSQGIDPGLDFHDIEAVRRVAEHATRMPVHPRHPYAGDLVYTAFSGSHQDAIKKGMTALPAGYDKMGGPVPADRPQAHGPHLRGHNQGQQPVRQGWRRLHHGHRARPRPSPPVAGRVLQERCRRSPRRAAPRSSPPSSGRCSRRPTWPRTAACGSWAPK